MTGISDMSLGYIFIISFEFEEILNKAKSDIINNSTSGC